MTYPQAIQYLETFINYEKLPFYPYKESFGLQQIRGFLASINNPQEAFQCIHVAGSKGKGSTCAFIAYILRQAGYKVGLYTSPHLLDFRERIRILSPRHKDWRVRQELWRNQLDRDFEGMIPRSELRDLVEELKPGIEKYNKTSRHGRLLSFFEVYTALAFVYFKKKKVDLTVLETGLGGRLDATNVINPLVSVITPISYEHTQRLGNTLGEIAREKAGIIKAGYGARVTGNLGRNPKPASRIPIVICAPQEKEAIGVIRERCRKIGARLYEIGRDINYQKTKDGFRVEGVLGEYPDLKIRLLGKYQLVNAAAAVGAIEALRFYNIGVGIDYIREGLRNAIWPGRCEVISRRPLVLLDGAQNIASSKVLKEAVRENFKYKRLILVLGISKDKDIKGICSELYDLADEVILTRADNPRATPPQILAGYFNGKKLYITNNVSDAKIKAYHIAKRQDLILVCGSLFVVGEFRNEKKRYQ